MILIADSGSTKTDWCLVDRGKIIRQIATDGMNPFFQTEEGIEHEVKAALLPNVDTNVFDALFFYGAGCIPEKVQVVRKALSKHLITKHVEVNTDLLAAARGLCGRQSGIACIIGTGSNSCFYDGGKIVHNVSPLGFILGDEGSGAALGKLLVGNILKNQTGPELKEKLLSQIKLTPAEIIDRVYRQPFPNRFLASLSPVLAQNIHEPSIHDLVLNSFKSFLERNVMQYDYQHYLVHFTGSIAFHYQNILQEAAIEKGIQIGKMSKSPMEGLIRYHVEKEMPAIRN